MGVIDTMIARRESRASVVNPRHPRDPVLAEWFGEGLETAAGETVTPATALRETAVLSSVRYISETMASLPLVLFQQDARDPRRKERAVTRLLYDRLHDQPNRWQSTFDWLDMLFHHVLLRGNFYNWLAPSAELPPFELVPLHPDRVTPFWAANGERAYAFHPPDGRPRQIILQSEMFHLPFMPDDGLTGVSVIKHAKEAIGRALAAARYGSRTYAGDNMPRGVLTHPKALSLDVKSTLREEWERRHGGPRNARRIAILQEGMKFEPIGMTNEDAQFIEFMQFDVADIARVFRVPPHKIGEMSRATFTNIEHQAIEAVVDTIRPWAVRFERRAGIDLLTPAERKTHFVKFIVDALLRGDSQARGEFYAKLWNIGALSQNDILEMEDRPPVPGGDQRFVPLNMVPLKEALDRDLPGGGGTRSASMALPALDGGEARRMLAAPESRSTEHLLRLRAAYQPLFADAARRTLRREADAVERQFRKLVGARTTRSVADFSAWVIDFYATFNEVAATALLPVVLSYAAAVRGPAAEMIGATADDIDLAPLGGAYASAYGARHAGLSRAALDGVAALAATDPERSLGAMDELLAGWRAGEGGRADTVAMEETVKAGSAFARESWRQVGVTRLTWVAGATACPLCESLDGETVGIEQEFVREGDTIDAEGVAPLRASKTLHPPLHNGCVCSIVPE